MDKPVFIYSKTSLGESLKLSLDKYYKEGKIDSEIKE